MGSLSYRKHVPLGQVVFHPKVAVVKQKFKIEWELVRENIALQGSVRFTLRRVHHIGDHLSDFELVGAELSDELVFEDKC